MNPKDRVASVKPNLSRLPLAPLLEVAAGLEEGARKYGPWNWRGEKVNETIYADAAIRHLMQFIAGEDIDPDSGLPHVVKAVAGLLILRDAQIHGCSIDDRAVNQDLNVAGVSAMIGEVHDKYPQCESNLDKREGAERPTPFDVQTEELTEELATKLGQIYGFDAVLDPTVDGVLSAEGESMSHMTHEDGTLSVWSETPAGDGSYLLKPTDIGKEVVLRSGRVSFIGDFDDDPSHPIDIVDQDGHLIAYVSENGHSDIAKTTPFDVIRVFHVRSSPNEATDNA